MKLILCGECWDVFKLDYDLRTCKCGKVKGRYFEDGLMAEVSENAISLALGNGSVESAVRSMWQLKKMTKNKADRREYMNTARIVYAWARPNDGPGNPHSQILKESKS